MCKMSLLDKISFILVILGSINWGILGSCDINLIQILTGNTAILMRIIYIVIGLSSLNIIYFAIKCTFTDTI